MQYIGCPIVIEEEAGLDRVREPVTVGIPFPRGTIPETAPLTLIDQDGAPVPVQTQVLARWPDKSPKWVLLDFQASVSKLTTRELKLRCNEPAHSPFEQKTIAVEEDGDYFRIDTGVTVFSLGSQVFGPFDQIIVGGDQILDASRSKTVLTDESGTEFSPVIKGMFFETMGPLRSTLKVEGLFESDRRGSSASFMARVHFYANHSMTKVEFAVVNPRAAKHLGGLWDLGDPGSYFFKDLSIHASLNSKLQTKVCWMAAPEVRGLNHGPSAAVYEPKSVPISNAELVIHQDSSGGENWRSRNHVNRLGQVRNAFKGYRVCCDGKILEEGSRINPILTLGNKEVSISCALQNFWQNFPKSLEARGTTMTARLFPKHHDDLYELQGGERKTHTLCLEVGSGEETPAVLCAVQAPLIPHATPEWYARSKAFHYLVPEKDDPEPQLQSLVNSAIVGSNTFFHRREVIDEYGWRNFGEFYADHEAVGHTGEEPLVSHYNNQYDCIYGALIQFAKSCDLRWYFLADQLCSHVKDIDIYHTGADRPEFNHGLFWHTDHYIDTQTATHRCFSRKHADHRNLANYGGGPSLSHTYSTGFLLHYWMTGDHSSKEAVEELACFVENNMDLEGTFCNDVLRWIKNINQTVKRLRNRTELVQLGKVYGLNGPGRASGNALNTLLDAYVLAGDPKYLRRAGDLIRQCIHPDDDIERRELLDIENRWMYTVFLQSLGRFLDLKSEEEDSSSGLWEYARQALTRYAMWMVEKERPYLERPEELEYPNETWAVQDIRKCNVLLYAAKYAEPEWRQVFLEKASYFYREALGHLSRFETKTMTRPIALMMLNGMMHGYCRVNWPNLGEGDSVPSRDAVCRDFRNGKLAGIVKRLSRISIPSEVEFLRWRVASKLRRFTS